MRCGGPVAGVRASKHHRKLRSQGGGNGPENQIILCGTGTTGCHGYVHAHVAEARARGWIVPSWADPLEVPVMSPEMDFGVLLGPDYEVTPWRGDGEAAELLD